jgi:hypothetical protein
MIPDSTAAKGPLRRMLSRLGTAGARLVLEHTVLVLALLAAVAVLGLLWHLSRLSEQLVQTAALQGTSQYARMLEELRGLYTAEVVARVEQHGVRVSHDYRDHPGAIPLPATLSLELGRRLNADASGIQFRLYSDRPFPWRTDGGPQDDFERQALQQLREQPDQPYFRFEEYQGRPVLRYARADRMRTECVHCHNTHPDSPYKSWKEGDVRGVLEVIRPLDLPAAQTRRDLRETFVLLVGLTGLGLSGLGLVIRKLRGSTAELERRNRELAEQMAERRSAEEAHARTLKLYRDLVETSHDLIWSVDVAGRWTFVNRQAARRIYGYEPEEMLGRPFTDFETPEQAQTDLQVFERIKAGTPYFQYVTTHRRKDGQPVVLSYNAVVLRDSAGKVLGTTGTAEDITARYRAEEALRESEQRYRTAMEVAPEAIVVLDVEAGRFIDANQNAVRLYGLTKEQLLQTDPIALSPPTQPDGRPSREAATEKLLAAVHGDTPVFEWVHLNSAGQEVPCEIRLVRLPAGQRKLVRGSVLDISARKHAEAEIRRLNAELEERVRQRTAQLEAANHELESFSYSVSHDLRAPLRSIDGFSQALLEDCGDRLDEKGKDYLQRVRAATQRMGQLIDDLLNLSRITRSEIRRERVDLSALARGIVAELQQREPGRDVTVTIADGLVVEGDSRLLRVVLENLLGNAWKFTSRQPKAAIEFGKTMTDGLPTFFVRDNGAGFDMTYVRKLFGAFQRLHTQRDFPGSGIGLATVQRIIQRHGGRVWAEGAVGQGATIWFRLQSH